MSNVELFQRIAVLYDNTVPFISWYFLILVLYLNMQLSFVLYVRGRGCKMHFFFFTFLCKNVLYIICASCEEKQ